MINSIHSHAKSNTLLYKLWFYTVRKHIGDNVRLPKDTDDFYFDGYPKSGNTYFCGLISALYPSLSFAHHLHTVAGLKIAARKKIPIFIIIRHPKDAIVSNIARKLIQKPQHLEQNLIDKMVLEYNNYYDYVTRSKSTFNVFNFSLAIKDETLIPSHISSILKLEQFSIEKFNHVRNEFKALMKQKEQNKTDMASALPNKKREAFKNKNRVRVQNSKYYKNSVEIFKSLTD